MDTVSESDFQTGSFRVQELLFLEYRINSLALRVKFLDAVSRWLCEQSSIDSWVFRDQLSQVVTVSDDRIEDLEECIGMPGAIKMWLKGEAIPAEKPGKHILLCLVMELMSQLQDESAECEADKSRLQECLAATDDFDPDIEVSPGA